MAGAQRHLLAPRSAEAKPARAPPAPPGVIYGADSAAQLRELLPGRERGGGRGLFSAWLMCPRPP